METLEFLGGKYQKKEQIVPGPVQTFRAREAGTSREVFVHRVSTTDEQAEQMALLRMLTTVLLRSSEARKLVLDFGEEQGFWYVVTASEPRCLMLREWLQFELNREASMPVPPASVSAEPSAPPSQPKEAPIPSAGSLGPEPGEFTRVFQSLKPEAVPPPTASSTEPAPKSDEPGEFTRFFQGGLAPSESKPPANPEVKRSQDRPSRGGFVQRPHTPMPPLQPKATESGEFTRLFAGPNTEVPKSGDGFADQASSKPDPGDPFSGSRNAPKAPVQERAEPGEYTRIFGAGTVPSPLPSPSAPANVFASPPADDPLRGTRPLDATPHAPTTPPKGPSEYTMVIQGSHLASDAGSAAGPATPNGGAENLSALPKFSVPPQAKVPAVSPPRLPAMPAPAAEVKVPVGGNKKLVIFFAILGILAVVLVLLVVLTAVKK
jgi:hypothetical protein